MMKHSKMKSNRFSVNFNTLEEEIAFTWNMMNRMKRLKKFGYNLSLPETPQMTSVIEKALERKHSEEDKHILAREISKIYTSDTYTDAFHSVCSHLGTVEKIFNVLERYSSLWNFKIFNQYSIHITQFGPGGCYDPPTGTIVIKNTNSMIKPDETMVHEIVHIGIEKVIIEKFDIPHQFKERIVDKFVDHHFRELLPSYKMKNFHGDSIDKFLDHEDSWTRLPHYIDQFKLENLKK